METNSYHIELEKLKRLAGRSTNQVIHDVGKKVTYFDSLDIEIRREVKNIVKKSVVNFFNWLSLDDYSRKENISSFIDSLPYGSIANISLVQSVEIIQAILESFDLLAQKVTPEFAQNYNSQISLLLTQYSKDIAFKLAQIYAKNFEEKQSDQQILERQFFQAIISDNSPPNEVIINAKQLGINPEQKTLLIVGKLSTEIENKYNNAHIFSYLKRILSTNHSRTGNPLISFLEDYIVILFNQEKIDKHIFSERFFSIFDFSLLLIEEPCFKVETLKMHLKSLSTYFLGLQLHQFSTGLNPTSKKIMTIQEILSELAFIGNSEAQKNIMLIIKKLLKETGNLIDTLNNFFIYNSNLEVVAEKMQVHPNSIRYRLNKIYALTGYNPKNTQDAFTLHLGLYLYFLDNNKI